MTRRERFVAFRPFLAVATIVATLAAAATAAEPLDYSRDVRPILAEHCIRCHGPDTSEAGLNLTDPKVALGELESGARAIVPHKPEASELLARVTSDDESVRMPPEGKPLTLHEIDVLRRWIAGGAEYNQHWSFRPLAKLQPPAVKDTARVRSPIDQFIAARLDAANIKPSPEAPRQTLIKRLYFDLLGLLPPPAEVDAFVADKSPDAYEKLIERLLASPHFGERWGRHWLDAARYADSDGYEKDRARPDAYVYRDWVIDAFNRDMPFDQFTIEQLAGDLLPRATAGQKIATAFNRQTLTNEEGGVDQEEYRIAAVFDRTDTLGTVWLGLTVGCARCHTHKYDPISHREYYQLFAFFNESDEVNSELPVGAKDSDELEARLAPLNAALAARRREIAPAEQQWEAQQRELIESTPKTPLETRTLKIVEQSSTGGSELAKGKDGVVTAAGEGDKAGETYSIVARTAAEGITGFRLDVLADDSLPKKGPGRSSGGNFVLNALSVELLDADDKLLRKVPLQRAKADYEQSGYKAADVLTDNPQPKRGWAVGGKVGQNHNLVVRTTEPLSLPEGARLRIQLDQRYGSAHTLGRFRLSALVGDARGLHLPEEIVRYLEMYPEKRVASTKAALFNHYASQDPEIRRLQDEIAAAYREFDAKLMTVRTLGSALKPRETHRFDRGDFLAPAEKVEPGTLAVLPALAAEGKKGPTRLDLARWLVSDANPLTPRVTANQVWAHLFGAGLVPTINDFGTRGQPPTHPELLDWLAASFRDDFQWSIKRLVREIVTSATYRQSSTHRSELVEVDPQNALLARQNRLRVEGEIVRDLALGAGGLLSPKIGGPSVFPPMPPDLAKLSYANNFSWTESKGEDRYRRGMYTFFKRTIPHPTLMMFDCPDANVACVDRTVSNTPLQALTLLNNVSFVEAAQSLARRLLETKAEGDDARIAQAVKTCLARDAAPAEIDRLADLLERARDYYRESPEAAEHMVGSYAVATIPNHELAAWTATVRVLMNLDEFITRD